MLIVIRKHLQVVSAGIECCLQETEMEGGHLRAEDGIVLSHFLCKGYFINRSRFDSTFLSLSFLCTDRSDQGADTDPCCTEVVYFINL